MTWPPTATVAAENTIPDLTRVIESAISDAPRSLQTALGPSEIGTDCDRCLIHLLASTRTDSGAPWLPTIGTAVHEWLEQVILRHEHATKAGRYLPECRVTVGQLRGVDITGTSDLYDTSTGTVVDFKVTGTTTLKKVRAAKGHPGRTYERQAQLYGRGWALAGFDVRSVAVWFLPRNGFRITDGHVWQEPYDEQVAIDALDRANRLASFIDTFGVDAVLASAAAHTGTEFSCEKYDATPRSEKQLDGLLPPQTPDARPGAGSTAA